MSSLFDRRALVPNNSTPLERAVEILTRRLDDIGAPLRQLWSAWDCPISLLPWLAYALSIDAWNAEWPENIKRAFVAQAIEVQRMKGTAASVRRVVQAFGGNIAIREWHQQDPPGEPYTFDVVLTLNGADGAPATGRFLEEVIEEIGRTKPARAHFTFTQGLSARGVIAVAGVARLANYRRLTLTETAAA